MVGRDIGAVRIDSGELLADSRAARQLLNELGAVDCRIVVSSDLDEFLIADLELAGAPIDAYLVGTSLVTGSGHPTASMVYKLVSIADNDYPRPATSGREALAGETHYRWSQVRAPDL